MTDPQTGVSSELSPDRVFAVLGNETRFDILRTLWEATTPTGEPTAIRFADLRRRVGLQDSGQFNYHLNRLTGRFVRRTDEGYVLTNAGLSVVQTVIARTETDEPTLPPSVVDLPCFRCGAPILVEYGDEQMGVSCTSCDGVWDEGKLLNFDLPPSVLRGREPTELLETAVIWQLHRAESMYGGVCPQCAGRVVHDIDVCPAHHPARGGRCPGCARSDAVVVTHYCRVCKEAHTVPFRALVLFHQALGTFYDDHEIQFTCPSWDALVRANTFEEVLSHDPFRFRVTAAANDESITFTFDDQARVIDVAREVTTQHPERAS